MPRRSTQRSQSMYRRDESSPDSYLSRQIRVRNHPDRNPRSPPLDRSSRSLPLDRSPRSPDLDYIPPSRSASRHARHETPKEDDPLSADAATRIMLEKWDLLDKEQSSTATRGRRAPTRSNSLPSTGRRKSRVREWEEWKPEMERIRLDQVEMEPRLEEEAEAHQLASMEKDRRDEERLTREGEVEEQRKTAIRNRKNTPRYKSVEVEEQSDHDGDSRRVSVISRCESTKAVRGDSEAEEPERRRRGSRNRRKEAEEPVPSSASRSSRQSRRPPKPASPTPPSAPRRNSSATSHSSSPLEKSPSTRARSAPVPYTQSNRSRSSRRKPRPISPTPSSVAPTSIAPSPVPSRSPSPPRRSRSSRRRRPPSQNETRGARSLSPSPLPASTSNEPDLLSSVQDAAEQVSTAVSNALNKVLPGFFSSASSSK